MHVLDMLRNIFNSIPQIIWVLPMVTQWQIHDPDRSFSCLNKKISRHLLFIFYRDILWYILQNRIRSLLFRREQHLWSSRSRFILSTLTSTTNSCVLISTRRCWGWWWRAPRSWSGWRLHRCIIFPSYLLDSIQI